MFAALAFPPLLQELILSNNPQVGDVGICAVADAIKGNSASAMTSLHLRKVGCSLAGLLSTVNTEECPVLSRATMYSHVCTLPWP